MDDWREVFIMSLIFGVIAFLFYESIRASFKWFLLLFSNFFVYGFIVFRIYGTLYSLPIRVKPRFIVISGPYGRIVRGPEGSHSNQITYWVAFPKTDIPKGKYKPKERTFFMIISDVLSGVKTIKITDNYNKFLEIPRNNLEINEGVVEYQGRLDGGPIHDKNTALVQRLVKVDKENAYMQTVMDELSVQLSNIAQQKTMDWDQGSQVLKTIADRVKNVKIITKGGQSVEALGDIE